MSKDPYTITLDDDPVMHRIIARMTNMPSLPFTHIDSLLKRASTYQPKAVFIDIHLSLNECGLDVVPRLRKIWPYVPILVITSDLNGELVAQSLAAGADDFVKKPLDHAEFLGRLNARISEMRERQRVDVMNFGNSSFHLKYRCLKQGEKQVYISPLVARLLTCLLDARGEILTKKVLMRGVWGETRVSVNSLDRRISELRTYLESIDSDARIHSAYGKGVSIEVLSLKEQATSRIGEEQCQQLPLSA